MNLILINKADFLSESQRQRWASYFDSINLPVAFFSALEENQNNQLRKLKLSEEGEDGSSSESNEEFCNEDYDLLRNEDNNQLSDMSLPDALAVGEVLLNQRTTEVKEEITNNTVKNSSKLLNRDELIELFKTIHKGQRIQEGRAVVGLVGYPNVGKSSTINSLLTYKKVSVSATPGKTKHFQVTISMSILLHNMFHSHTISLFFRL